MVIMTVNFLNPIASAPEEETPDELTRKHFSTHEQQNSTIEQQKKVN